MIGARIPVGVLGAAIMAAAVSCAPIAQPEPSDTATPQPSETLTPLFNQALRDVLRAGEQPLPAEA